MRIVGLGYVGLTTRNMAEWSDFARHVLGVEPLKARPDGVVRLRLDNHDHRISLRPAEVDDLDYIGWECADETSFRAGLEHLRSLGVTPKLIEGEQAVTDRGVTAYASFVDPAGLNVELFYGAHVHGKPTHNAFGAKFVTGPLGIGHVFVMVDNFADTRVFYEALGFKVSDRAGSGSYLLYRCGPREHAFGIGDTGAGTGLPRGLQHMMLQVDDMDAVGRSYDACLDGHAKLATTLGRHSNDLMFSFYVKAPGGFDMEYGYGGITVDEATWVVKELTDESLWGHRPFSRSVEAQLVAGDDS